MIIRTRTPVSALLALALGCMRGHAEPPRPLFDSRAPIAQLRARLKASGGDAARILRPVVASDLDWLAAGKRHKFVVLWNGRLAVAPLPADAPGNEYSHPILADGEPVLSAGGLRIERSGAAFARVVVDQDSRAYCPTADSLAAALGALARLGVAVGLLRVENRPPDCLEAGAPSAAMAMSPAAAKDGSRYGALMAEIGRRYEMMGRAAKAGRFELARFELDELGEVFKDDLPRAALPRESQGIALGGVASAFVATNLKELGAALQRKDLKALAAAMVRASETCNGCHQVSGHRFVEVPSEIGASVPDLTDER